MSFFTNAIDVLQTLVIALGGGLCVWVFHILYFCFGVKTRADAHVR